MNLTDLVDQYLLCERLDYDLTGKYQFYNDKLFDGKLPMIPITWANMKRVGGHVEYKVVRQTGTPIPSPMEVRLGLKDKYHGATIKPDSLNMKISSMFKRSEEGLDGILVHEMIHVYMAINSQFSENHGYKFTSMLRQLQAKVGFKIPLTDSTEGMELNREDTRQVGVVLLTKKDGYRVALLSEKTLRAALPILIEKWKHFVKYDYVLSASFYLVDSPGWTALSYRMVIQRAVKSLKFQRLKDPALVAELESKGTRLEHLEKQNA